MTWEYSEKTKQIFMDAVQGKPGTHMGEIKNPDGLGEHGSIACGDALRFTFRVEQHPTDPTRDVITEARYLTFGCTSAIAASEALCTLIERGGYTPIQALKITNEDIVKFLEGLPEEKIHDFSHLAMTMPPDDPHYGKEGDYKNCLHYRKRSNEKKICLEDDTIGQGAISSKNKNKI